MPCSYSTALHIINQELAKSYIDRDVAVLNAFKEFIIGSSDSFQTNSVTTLATPNFHYVWEKACRTVFPHNVTLLSNVPKPFWQVGDEHQHSSQRPDILCTSGDACYIIDAKYYYFSQNKPGGPDIIKQFFYRESFEGIEKENIHNIMFFPGTHSEKMDYLGHAQLSTGKFGKIWGISGDLQTVLELYASYGKEDWLDALKLLLTANQ